jgi:hypothetical protein
LNISTRTSVDNSKEEDVEPRREKLKKNWTDDPAEYVSVFCVRMRNSPTCQGKKIHPRGLRRSVRSLPLLISPSSLLFCSIRERLKEVLRQYELRERHFECVIRSKELEVLLSRARAAEQKQLAEGEKARFERQEEEACCCSHQCTAFLTISGVPEHSAAEGPRGCSKRADNAH